MEQKSTEYLTNERYNVKLYKLRWYIILIVSTANIINNFLWATWGPIADSAKFVYNWTDNTIFWITNAGNISAFLATFLAVYIIDTKGIRWAMIMCTFSLAVSCSSRIVTQTQPAATVLITLGQVVNGVATSVTMTIPPTISETWFHVGERNTATAISCMSAAIGAGASFLLGPFMVSMPDLNQTGRYINNTENHHNHRIHKEMYHLHYIAFGVASVLFLATILHLPSKPPTPPSKSASLTRYSFKQGLTDLIKKPYMWYMGCVYAIPMGTYGTWGTVLYPTIENLHFTQVEVGWIGFYSSIAGTVAAVIVARISDKFRRKQKVILVILYTSALIFFLWFACMCTGILPRSKALLYCAAITGSMFMSATGPPFLEVTCEISYPTSEGIAAGMLGFILNIAATIYLLVTQIPGLHTEAMNWVLCSILGVSVPMLVLARVTYQRVDIDDSPAQKHIPNESNLQD